MKDHVVPTNTNSTDQIGFLDNATLSVVFQDAPVGFSRTTPGGRILYANNTLAHMLGYESSEQVYADIHSLADQAYAHPEERQRICSLVNSSDAVRDFELRARRKDGSLFWISIHARAIRDPHGNAKFYDAFCVDISERKEKEHALMESEALLDAVSEAQGTILYVKDIQGRIRRISANFYNMTQLQPDDVLGKTSYEVFTSYIGKEHLENDLQVLASGSTLQFEESASTPEGIHHFISVKSPLRDENGNIIGLVGIAQDITDLIQAEQRMQFIARQRQLALDAARMGWWRYDPQSKVASFDYRYREIFHVNTPQCHNDEILARVHPEDLSGLLSKVEAALNPQAPAPYETEFRIFLPDNSLRWIKANGIATFEKAGEAMQAKEFVGTVQDITDAVKAREKLAQRAKAHELLTRVARELSMAPGQDMIIAVVRSAVRDLTGADGATFVLREGNNCHYVDEEAVSPLWKGQRFPMEQCVSGWVMLNRRPAVIEDIDTDSRVTKDIFRQTFVKSLVMVPVNREKPVAAIGAYWAQRGVPDTENLEILQSLADLTSVAMENVRLYTALREQVVELEAQKLAAEEAHRTKSEFLANMSHEIRTPLNGIMGMLQLLGASPLEDEERQYVNVALQSSLRLTTLLSDILDLSRIEAGKLQIVREAFSISSLIDTIAELQSSTAQDKGIDLEFAIAPDVPPILEGDHVRLRQVLFNLVGNAIKFTVQGRVKLEISLASRPAPDRARVLFTISDTGIGISEALMDNLFQPFVQGEGNYTRHFQGAGLGLAIVHRLVDLLDGGLALESSEGRGTTFFLSIPFQLPIQDHDSTGNDAPCSKQKPCTVLVTEDDSLSMRALKGMLEYFGYACVEANNGRDALRELEQQEIDLVLMDVQLPVLDGMETTQAIRKGEAGLEKSMVPIIAMTAYAMSGDRETFLNAGMNDYIAKPIEMDTLQLVLRRNLKKSKP